MSDFRGLLATSYALLAVALLLGVGSLVLTQPIDRHLPATDPLGAPSSRGASTGPSSGGPQASPTHDPAATARAATVASRTTVGRSYVASGAELGIPPHPAPVAVGAPPPFAGHYYVGAAYSGAPTTATDIRVNLTVPDDFPEGGPPHYSDFYYVILSIWDNNGSYDQIGFANAFGTWGIAYSTTSFCAATYYYSPDAFELQRGLSYTFAMTLGGGFLDFAVLASPSGAVVWRYSTVTGASAFVESEKFTCGGVAYYDYTDYEEVYNTSGGHVPYDLFFTANSAGGAPVTDWVAALSAGKANLLLGASAVTIENEPYYLGFTSGEDSLTLGTGSGPSLLSTNVSVGDLIPDAPIALSLYAAPAGWAVDLATTSGDPPFTSQLSIGVPANTPSADYLIGINSTDGGSAATWDRTALSVAVGPEYTLSFGETGLPAAAPWAIVVGGTLQTTTSANLSTSLPNGTYSYEIAAVPGFSERTLPYFGNLTIGGLPLVEPTLSFAQVSCFVTFQEAGIPPRVLAAHGWTVELNGTVRHSAVGYLGFEVPPGELPVLVVGPRGYGSPHASGTITIVGSTSILLSFERSPTLRLTFTSKGLEHGQAWCVQLDGEISCANSTHLAFGDLAYGVYSYGVVGPTAGQNISAKLGPTSIPISGNLSLTRNERIALDFVYPWLVTFEEVGLAGGNWSVTIHGVSHSAPAGSPIQFELGNGTHPFRVGKVTGFTSMAKPSIRVVVRGAPASVSVTFHPTSGLSPTGQSALARPAGSVSMLGALGLAARRRR